MRRMSKLPISGVVLTLNEAENIRRCLESMAFCDDLLVVDSGSRDTTLDIARELGARIIERDWPGYGAQRQFGAEAARHDWVLCLDADEWLSPQLAHSIQAEFENGPEHRAYSFPRQNFILGRPLRHGGDYPDRKLRLFDRKCAHWNADVVHAVVETDEPVEKLHQDLMHYTAESLDEAVAKWARFAMMQAREMQAAGVRASALNLVLNPVARFVKLYLFKQGFRDGVPGLTMATMSSYFCFLKYLELWRLCHETTGAAERDGR